jgi:hypothetical protein
MKNAYQTLLERHSALAKSVDEMEALRISAPLLRDKKDSATDAAKPTRTAALIQRVLLKLRLL